MCIRHVTKQEYVSFVTRATVIGLVLVAFRSLSPLFATKAPRRGHPWITRSARSCLTRQSSLTRPEHVETTIMFEQGQAGTQPRSLPGFWRDRCGLQVHAMDVCVCGRALDPPGRPPGFVHICVGCHSCFSPPGAGGSSIATRHALLSVLVRESYASCYV